MRVQACLAALVGVLLMAGCGDGVTLSDVDPSSPDLTVVASTDEEHQAPACCDPIVVVVPGPECDPYLSLSWCSGSGGDCMSATDEFQATFGCIPPGGGGGGGGPCDPSWDPRCPPPANPGTTCDPAIHPDCEKPLEAQDSATIQNALATMVRPVTQFTDSTAAGQCADLLRGFQRAMANGAVFRGAFDSNSANDPGDAHYGMYNSGNIHFDPAGLNAANTGDVDAIREVAITALHEAGHFMGYDHPAGATFDAQGRDSYTDAPFNRLNPGSNSCVSR